MGNYIRFDWAMKRLLRQKANYVILEGLLSVLLGEKIRIRHILESKGNKETEDDKFNRVDLLAEDTRGQLMIVEIQNNRELDYFHRMLYGTSKVITEYIREGEDYEQVRKVYSINIIYFDLGQGDDYIYHGRTHFVGLHTHDELKLSASQRRLFMGTVAGDLFPEYYVLRVNDFDKIATTPLDEWISFLKTGEIPDDATADGLPEAREQLRRDKLSPEELAAYKRHLEAERYQRSVIRTGRIEGLEEGRKEGKKEGIIQTARNLKSLNLPPDIIARATGLTTEEIAEL